MAEIGIMGGPNTFVPSMEAGGQMQVEFSRNPRAFALNRYVEVRPVKKMLGKYLRIDEAEGMRVASSQEYLWPLGADAPIGESQDHEFFDYSCYRYSYAFNVPTEQAEQASWDIVAAHGRMAGQKAMTARTRLALAAATNTSNWPTGNKAADLTALLGGTPAWDSTATDANNYIQQSILAVGTAVSLATGGVIGLGDLTLTINPNRAKLMAASQELRAYVKNHPLAINYLQGGGTFNQWGLPPTLYGLKEVVVDATGYVSTRKGASTETKAFALGDNAALFTYRAGPLVSPVGEAPTLSTLVCFAYEDFTVETKQDYDNRRTQGRVVDNIGFAVAAPLSGYLISDVST